MTLSDADVKELIELADAMLGDDAVAHAVCNYDFSDAANPTTVKAMAEELLAARAVRDKIYFKLRASPFHNIECDVDRTMDFAGLVEEWDAIRAKNCEEK